MEKCELTNDLKSSICTSGDVNAVDSQRAEVDGNTELLLSGNRKEGNEVRDGGTGRSGVEVCKVRRVLREGYDYSYLGAVVVRGNADGTVA